MDDFDHVKRFKDIISECQILLKMKLISSIDIFSSLLTILKDRHKTDKNFEFLFELNEQYKQIIKPLPEVEIVRSNNIITIDCGYRIIYDVKYGVIDSSILQEELKFEKDHKSIIYKIFSIEIQE